MHGVKKTTINGLVGFTTSLISFGLWFMGFSIKQKLENAHPCKNFKKNTSFFTLSSASTYFLGTLQKNIKIQKMEDFD